MDVRSEPFLFFFLEKTDWRYQGDESMLDRMCTVVFGRETQSHSSHAVLFIVGTFNTALNQGWFDNSQILNHAEIDCYQAHSTQSPFEC